MEGNIKLGALTVGVCFAIGVGVGWWLGFREWKLGLVLLGVALGFFLLGLFLG